MLNLTKMNMFRTFKSRSTWLNLIIMLLIAAVLFFMSSSFGESMISDSPNNPVLSEIDEEGMMKVKEGVAIGFASMDFTSDTRVNFDFLLYNFISSGIFLIFTGVFITNLVCNRSKSRFQKNLSIYSSCKWKIPLSQNLPLLAFCAIQVSIISLLYLVCSLFYFNTFHLGSVRKIIFYIVMQIVMHYAFGSFIMFIADLTKSKVAGVTVACVTALGIGTLFLGKLDDIFKFKHFSFVKATPEYHVKALSTSPDNKALATALAVVILSAVVYNVLNAVISSKRDMA